MPRNMIAANKAVFRNLDEYCASRGDPIGNANAARWIATQSEDRRLLKESTISDRLLFTARRGVVRVDHGSDCYFCAIGFDYSEAPVGLVLTDLGAGLLTVLLAELNVPPRVTPIEVRNIVEAAYKDAPPEYGGHDFRLMQTLYPVVDVFSGSGIASDETWKVFFLMCLAECRGGETWIKPTLADELQMLADLPLINIPYRTLCRSIFDTDPGAMFLALYRCLEAVYAFSSARELIAALNLKHDWADVAATLENTLGWHPREEGSLIALFAHGAEIDHRSIFSALGENAPLEASGSISVAAARRVYKLRNDLVHYRPSQARVDYSQIDWNALCQATVGLVCYIYAEVFVVGG